MITMQRLEDDRYYAELEDETGRLAEAVHDADLARPVPTCPEWTLAQLAEHVGRGHRWAAGIVERRDAERVPVPAGEVEGMRMPDGADERSAWLLAGARRLADVVREARPETGVWTWASDRTAGFWLRRMTHDTLVHRLDADLALGRDVAVAPEVAADSVSDFLTVLSDLSAPGHPGQRFAELRGQGQTLHFHATDEGVGALGEWLARRTPTGVEWEHRHGKGDVAVRGRALDLLLVLHRRTAPDQSPVEVLGDRGLLDHWLEHSVF
jgi:uncharacterized protein (TIGR03083 family)